jgi:hypothetical protein
MMRSSKKLLLPVVRFGSLIFLECDLRKSLPEQADLPGVTTREAFAGDEKLFEYPQIFLERLSAGHRCFVGIDSATGKLANYRWLTTSAAYIPEIDRYVILKPGEVYSYDLNTLPGFRRRGIDTYARSRTYQLLGDEGHTKILAYVRGDNVPMLQSSRLLLKPIGRVWYVQRRGSRCFVFGGRGLRLPELVTSYSRSGVQFAER